MHGERNCSGKAVGFDGPLRCLTLPREPPRITSAVASKRLYNDRMLIRHAPDLRFSDITPKTWYLRRREFLQTAAGAALGAAAAAVAPPFMARVHAAPQKEGTGHGVKLPTSSRVSSVRPAKRLRRLKTSPVTTTSTSTVLIKKIQKRTRGV